MGEEESVEDELGDPTPNEDEGEADDDGEIEDTPPEDADSRSQPTPTYPSSSPQRYTRKYEFVETDEEREHIDIVTGILLSFCEDAQMRQQILTMIDTPGAIDGLVWRLFGQGTKQVMLDNGETVHMTGNDPNHWGYPSRDTYPSENILTTKTYVDQYLYGNGGWGDGYR
ncbi:MAG: hypothetical protein TREMPRED_005817 [Tremellales sp. Tagirdzhanova-0007]|nr:MAG: hypothetical protein TREMPRED_005817 [Tremellales sp. Tagirdzhanova-0007]